MEQSWRTHHQCWTYNNIYVGVAVCPPRIPIWPLPRNDVVEQANWSPLIYMYSHCRVKSMMNMTTEAPMTPSYGHWSPDNTHIWPLKPRYIGAYQYDHRLPVTTDRLLSTKVTPFKRNQTHPKTSHKPDKNNQTQTKNTILMWLSYVLIQVVETYEKLALYVSTAWASIVDRDINLVPVPHLSGWGSAHDMTTVILMERQQGILVGRLRGHTYSENGSMDPVWHLIISKKGGYCIDDCMLLVMLMCITHMACIGQNGCIVDVFIERCCTILKPLEKIVPSNSLQHTDMSSKLLEITKLDNREF